ncbi:MAG: acetylornithine deacetylase [marine bacterium B5-7]|nr:MAG: acetylornithine deacetylase [marine bacterium B5-7]
MATFDSLQMTRQLVSYDTVSRDSNLPLIEFTENWLVDNGIDSFRISSDDGTKSNLVASIGPAEADGIILSGHTDVVPVDGQPWSADPFAPWVDEGRLYGRGTCDMKGFIAVALAAVPRMTNLKRPIHLALSYDEEVGCKGAPRMIDAIRRKLPPCRAVVIGEPTCMQAVRAHKGIVALKTTVTGYETHSSQTHRGVSAVMTAARLVSYLDTMATTIAHQTHNDNGFEPPYTTVHVGIIRGGTAINIISRECEFIWDIRAMPQDNPQSLIDEFETFCRDEVLPELKRRHFAVAIDTQILANAPGFEVSADSYAVEMVQRLTGIKATQNVSYAAEAGQYQAAGLASVICGPGSIDQAHQPDEYLELSELQAAEHLIDEIIEMQS